MSEPTLQQLRAELAEVLAPTKAKVTTFVPERLVPPSITIEPAEPYITAGDAFGTYRVHYLLTVAVDAASNEVQSSRLDLLVAEVLTLLDEARWEVSQAGGPIPFDYNQGKFLGLVIDVATTTRLGGDHD